MAATIQPAVTLADRQYQAVTIPTAGVVAVQLANGMPESIVTVYLAPGLIDRLMPGQSKLYQVVSIASYTGVVLLEAHTAPGLVGESTGQVGITTYTAPAPTAASVGAQDGELVSQAQALHDAAYPLRGLYGYNVREFGAVGDGITDDTAAIQAAINAAAGAGGGTVYVPGPYLISTTLTVTADNVHLIGDGRSSQLVAAAAFPAAPMIWIQGPGGTSFRHGIVLQDLLLINTANSAATGIQLDSTYYATVERVDIEGVYATSLFLNGTSTAFGAYTAVRDCHIGATSGGGGSAGTGISSNNHEHWTVDHCTINWFNGAGGVGIKVTSSACDITNCHFDECDTALWLFFCQLTRVLSNNFDRGRTRFLYLNGCNNCRVIANDFDTFAGTPSQDAVLLDNNCADNIVLGNTWQTGTSWTNAIHENVNSAHVNYYTANDLGGLAVVRNFGIFRQNVGYNPRGHAVAQPAVPASGTAQTNSTETDCMVYVAGGTVSAIAIGGTSTGLTAGAVRVPAGQTITLTYTAAPTWQWFGD